MPAHVAPALLSDTDAHRFLADTLARQTAGVARHTMPGGATVWVKKAGPRHGRWRYAVLGALARLLRLDLLRPVRNPGGAEAIACEARRLRELARRGLRVPAVLAEQRAGLLLADLGTADAPAHGLGDELGRAIPGGAATLLPPWTDGLDAIVRVHAHGTCLSQAFARNLVRCPDGGIGYIDFEDNPLTVLTLAQGQARDWLSYLHATAEALQSAGAMAQAAAVWQAHLAQGTPEVQAALQRITRRMSWLQRLPADRRWGRDLQRVGAAARLLALAARPPQGGD